MRPYQASIYNLTEHKWLLEESGENATYTAEEEKRFVFHEQEDAEKTYDFLKHSFPGEHILIPETDDSKLIYKLEYDKEMWEQLLNYLNEIKCLSYKLEKYDKFDLEERLPSELLVMPDHDKETIASFTTLEEFGSYMQRYLGEIPEEVLDHFAALDMEDVKGNKYYNELSLGKADLLVAQLQKLISQSSAEYFVSVYDMDDHITIPCVREDDALELAKHLSPATAFHLDEGHMVELAAY